MPVDAHPHANEPVVHSGAPVERARAAIIAIHGRGASPYDILTVCSALDRDDDVAYLAPTAANRTWYPYRFIEPTEVNEPFLTSALQCMASLVDELHSQGVPHERIVFLGFSQGACLSAEFVARHPKRWGGLVVLSGGLIGPRGTTWTTPGTIDGTPVFVGCSNVDAHIPLERVEETSRVLEQLGGDVTTRIYDGMGHTVNADEIEHARRVVDAARAFDGRA